MRVKAQTAVPLSWLCWFVFITLWVVTPSPAQGPARSSPSTPAKETPQELTICKLLPEHYQQREFYRQNPGPVSLNWWLVLTNQSEHCLQADEVAAAESFGRAALALADHLQDTEKIGLASLQLGRLALITAGTETAREYFQQSREALQGRNWEAWLEATEYLASLLLHAENQPVAARQIAKEAVSRSYPPNISGKSWFLLARLTVIAGFASYQMAETDPATSYLEQAVTMLLPLANQPPEMTVLAQAYLNLGQVKRSLGQHQIAVKHYRNAESWAGRAHDKTLLADVWNSLGVLYDEQRDYEKAIYYLEKSIQTQDAARSGAALQERHNLGFVMLRSGRLAEAGKLFRQVFTAVEHSGRKEELTALEGLGWTELQQGRYGTAFEWLSRARQLADKQQDLVKQSELDWLLAEYHLAVGKNAGAASLAALVAQRAAHQSWLNLAYLAALCQGKAEAAQGHTEAAEAAWLSAIAHIEKFRQQIVTGGESLPLFFSDKLEPYYLLMRSKLEKGQPEAAWEFAERAKGRALLDLYAQERPLASDPELADKQRELAQSNSAYLAARRDKLPPRAIRDLESRLEEARLAVEVEQDRLSRLNVAARNTLEIPSWETMTRLAPPNTVLLEYTVAPDGIYLFAGRGTEGGRAALRVVKLALSAAELTSKVGKWREQIAHIGAYRELAKELYRDLILPAEGLLDSATHIMLVPDGCLWELPWAALVNRHEQHLIEAYNLLAVTSFTWWAKVVAEQREKGAPSNRSVLALGNPTIPRQFSAWQPLTKAETEARQVAALYHAQSRVLTRQAAREDWVKREAAKFTVLHFATHGTLDNARPLFSNLLLAAGSGEDGLLEAWEIAGLRLRAELVVLSACATGQGQVVSGEGLIGLAWAFSLAGSQSALVSQWGIDSNATSRLLTDFHKFWQQGKSKAEALRQATVPALKYPPPYNHPYYWGAFVLLGDGF